MPYMYTIKNIRGGSYFSGVSNHRLSSIQDMLEELIFAKDPGIYEVVVMNQKGKVVHTGHYVVNKQLEDRGRWSTALLNLGLRGREHSEALDSISPVWVARLRPTKQGFDVVGNVVFSSDRESKELERGEV